MLIAADDYTLNSKINTSNRHCTTKPMTRNNFVQSIDLNYTTYKFCKRNAIRPLHQKPKGFSCVRQQKPSNVL